MTRESPAFSLIEIMEKKGAVVDYHDPLIPKIPKTRKHAKLAGRASLNISCNLLQAVDAVIICTDHDDIDYSLVAESAQLIIDTAEFCSL